MSNDAVPRGYSAVQSHLNRKAAGSDRHPPSDTAAIFLHDTIFPPPSASCPQTEARPGQACLFSQLEKQPQASWDVPGPPLGRGRSECCSSPQRDKPRLGQRSAFLHLPLPPRPPCLCHPSQCPVCQFTRRMQRFHYSTVAKH